MFELNIVNPRRATCLVILSCSAGLLWGQSSQDRTQSDASRERFLRDAKIVSVESAALGVTRPLRATLSDGKTTHEALVQRVNKVLPPLFAPDERPMAWRDCYVYNYAAYAVDRLLQLYVSPVTVLREYDGQPAAFTWWVDDVSMDEQKRLMDKIVPPVSADWSGQLATANIFDQLIFNTDRNLGNILINKDWRIVLIDHTRSFPAKGLLREPDKLTSITPELSRRLTGLTHATVAAAVGDALTAAEIRALLARRDLILEHFRSAVGAPATSK